MSEKYETYYSLKYQYGDGIHKKGEQVLAAVDVVNIGQREDCQVHFENSSIYEDELFAIIRKGSNEEEWQLVPTSPYVQTYVNGNPVSLVSYLENKDRISFEGEAQELVFQIHKDGKFNEALGVQLRSAPMPRYLIALFIILPVVLFGVVMIFFYNEKQAEKQKNELINSVTPYILQLDVDSVYYVQEVKGEYPQVLRSYSYITEESHAISGTAFVTADHRIITARHCIEPWLNDGQIANVVDCNSLTSVPTKWAVEAETYNQLHDNDTTYRVVSVCQFYKGEHGTELVGESVRSDAFYYRTDRDYIMEIGDFTHEYYWRSIKGTNSNKAMILDDVAWCNTSMDEGLYLPSTEEIDILMEDQPHLIFIGYPDYDTKGREIQEGSLKLTFKHGETIAHDGKLTHGYSGGPVLVIKDRKIYVVGVISRVDGSGGDRMYSVPIFELVKKGGKQ